MECQICSKQLSSNKALGGHMKSHYAMFPLPQKKSHVEKLNEPVIESTSSLISSHERGSNNGGKSLTRASYGLRANPKKSLRFVDPQFFNEDSFVVDKESAPEPASRRRCKKVIIEDGREATKKERVQESSPKETSEFEMEEDVARCLIMLSKDVPKSSNSGISHNKEYACKICEKIFKSRQGLGSHKASHNRKPKI